MKAILVEEKFEEIIFRRTTNEPFQRLIVARYDPDGYEYSMNLFDLEEENEKNI